jgi:hypothetical protein
MREEYHIFLDPTLPPARRDKVNSGIGLSYRHARRYMVGGPVRHPSPMQELTLSPSQGSMKSATGSLTKMLKTAQY